MTGNKDSRSGFVHECFYRCNSKKHSSNLTAVVTKDSLSDEKVAAYLKWCCVKYMQALDSNGRSLIHVAAAKGRLKLLMFLLTHREVNINRKDQESGYTALHRSLFYGQLHCAVRLIQLGANFQQNDLDDLTPLDHVMKDCLTIHTYNTQQPCEVYIWGTNTKYTLGIGHHNSRSNPEPLDFFRKGNISIKQAFMSKFHSLFLGSDGRVWSCGVGAGGRLGLGDEATILVPKAVRTRSSNSEVCASASIGVDHSVLLMENGSVLSFGLNNYYQLGHTPPPEKVLFPKVIKSLKGIEIVGVSASKFHSAFWTERQLFTCGLHGGQLGHSITNENRIATPRAVNSLTLKTSTIKCVATSDGATAVATSKGDVYLFHKYECRKLTTKFFKPNAKKICLLGGQLNHKMYSNHLEEEGGNEIKVVILTDKNHIYLWQGISLEITRCLPSLRRYINITDMVLNETSMILITDDGEAFQGDIKDEKIKTFPEKEKNLNINRDKEDWNIKLRRIPNVYRAVNAACDLKGRNFAVVQVHPKNGLMNVPSVGTTEMKKNMNLLLTTTSEFDTLHDVIFEVKGTRFPAHRYVVSHSCEVLQKMISKGKVIGKVYFVKIENVEPQIFRRLLTYLYTGECDLLKVGICPIRFDSLPVPRVQEEISCIHKTKKMNTEKVSAFNYSKQQRSNKTKSESKIKNKTTDPINTLRNVARRFQLTPLLKILETLFYNNGYICKKDEKNIELPELKFDRKSCKDLWDITLKAENGSFIKAHKCILTARLEYFNCMINQNWLESSSKTPLNFPIPETVLEVLIDYLYTDEAPEIVHCHDANLISHVLVIADQYLCTRLKEIAEGSMINIMNLKNAAEVLQLAVFYNAKQLKQCAMEFICLNLTAFLEARSLEILDDRLLTDLKDFYRSWLPCMKRRNIATNLDDPDDAFVETIYHTEPVSLEKPEAEKETLKLKTSLKTPKKKSQREKKNSESERILNTSVGSSNSEEIFNSSNFCNDEKGEETWITVTNHSTKLQKREQTKRDVLSTEVEVLVPTSEKVVWSSEVKKDGRCTESDKNDLLLRTSSDKEFPSLNASVPERMNITLSPKRPSKSSKKFVKLSQKQRKRLAIQSIGESEDGEKKRKWEPGKLVGAISKVESRSVAVLVRKESKTNSSRVSSPPWQGSSLPTCSLSAIMAEERHRRDLLTRMKSKSFEYTQMEDKAINDLTLLYNIRNVTDERITVRRADSILFSPPV